jgi:predicted esterase
MPVLKKLLPSAPLLFLLSAIWTLSWPLHVGGTVTSPTPGEPVELEDFEARVFDDGNASTYDLHYRLFVPPQYDSTQQYPLVVELHGLGQGGSDNSSQLETSPVVYELLNAASRARHPFLMVSPQSINQRFTGSPQREQLLGLIEALRAEFSIDPKRIFITGMSAGGNATFVFAAENPSLFAAYAPVAGFGATGLSGGITDLPAWYGHGSGDTVVSVANSRNLVSALRNAGGNILYSEFPGIGHTSWDLFYSDPAFIDWLLGQKKGVRNQASVAGPHLRILEFQHTDTLSMQGIAGGASGEIETIRWSNIANGRNGLATGSPNWSISGIPLVTGENRIVVVASTSKNLTFNDTILINHSGAEASGVAPALSLDYPTSSHDLAIEDGSVTFFGRATGTNLAEVTWKTDRGDGGIAAGTTDWTASMVLPEGVTLITFVVRDSAGREAASEVRVDVNPDEAPVLSGGDDIVLTLPQSTARLMGSIIDDGDSGNLSVTWRQVGGPEEAIVSDPYSLSTEISLPGTGDYIFRLSATDLAHFVEADVHVALNPVPPLVRWRNLSFGTTEEIGDAADEADPDGDGFANLMEFFHGTDPTNGNSVPTFGVGTLKLEGDRHLLLRFSRAIEAEEVEATLEISDNLNEWQMGELVATGLSEPISAEAQWLTSYVKRALEGESPIFARFGYTKRALPETTARFLRSDESSRGTWKGVYGEQGYIIPRHRVSFPAFAQFELVAGDDVQWSGQLTEPPAVQKANSANERLASNFHGENGDPLELSLALGDRQSHRLTLYFLDWDSTERRQQIEIFDLESGALLDRRSIDESFHDGLCLSWLVRGDIRIVITAKAGANPVVSALFLDPVE